MKKPAATPPVVKICPACQRQVITVVPSHAAENYWKCIPCDHLLKPNGTPARIWP